MRLKSLSAIKFNGTMLHFDLITVKNQYVFKKFVDTLPLFPYLTLPYLYSDNSYRSVSY